MESMPLPITPLDTTISLPNPKVHHSTDITAIGNAVKTQKNAGLSGAIANYTSKVKLKFDKQSSSSKKEFDKQTFIQQ